MPFGVDDIIGIISLGSGLMSGLAGLGTDNKEKRVSELLDQFDSYTNYFEKAPFTKQELLKNLLPNLQQGYRGASDVAAGRVGSLLGEQGLAQGGGFADAYMSALAPIIAQGENRATNAEMDVTKLFSQIDATTKSQLLQLLSSKANVVRQAKDTTGFQDFITNLISGANVGATIGGNLVKASTIEDSIVSIGDALKKLLNQ